jgi:hypothetical protein
MGDFDPGLTDEEVAAAMMGESLPPEFAISRDEFIRARLEDLSREEPWGLEDFISSFVCSTLEILDLHKKWPILVKQTPEPAVVYDQLSADQIIATMVHKINWLTQEEYLDRFGTEPPTDPILDSIARIWRSHEDYDPAWS